MDEVEFVIGKLSDSGFAPTQLSVVTKDIQDSKKVQGFITTGDITKTSAEAGAWVGGLFGLLTGAAFLVVPGVGPIVIAVDWQLLF